MCEREIAGGARGVDALLDTVLGCITEAIIADHAAGQIKTISAAASEFLYLTRKQAIGETALRLFQFPPELANQLPLSNGSISFVETVRGQSAGAVIRVRERRDVPIGCGTGSHPARRSTHI